MGIVFRLLRLTVLLATLAVVAAIGVAGYLVFSGGDSRPDCAPAAGSTLQQAARTLAFDAKLAGFLIAGGRGFLTSISFDEAEATARTESYFTARTDGASDFALCFENGDATGFARLKTVLGRRIGVSGEGAMDLSGAHPRLELTGASILGVPLPAFLRRRIQDRANDDLADIPILVPLKLQFSNDKVTLTR